MKISLAWLNTYLEPVVGPDVVGSVLPRLGFPIEEVVEVPGEVPDRMFDVEVTSNRGDCLSHIGIAREVAAGSATGETGAAALHLPSHAASLEVEGAAEAYASVTVEAPEVCPRYTARVVRGVRVGPSPAWLVQRLETIGLRSVNNVVDVTNFVLHEYGQPLHAFDLGRLEGSKIVVRFAHSGEMFVAIDGSRHALHPRHLVIADASRPVAVAGVMGGLETEVGESTTDILLESAIFDPLSVRRTSRALKLASDSSFRFERGVDPQGVDTASRRAIDLIGELAGGRVADGVLSVGDAGGAKREVVMRLARCANILGVDLATDAVVAMLRHLELEPSLDTEQRVVRCRIPSFRLDLQREIDLVEEVARLHGMDRIGVRDEIAVEVRPTQGDVAARRAMASVLVGYGFHEAVTFTFVSPELGAAFLPPGCAAIEVDEACRRVGTRAEPMLRPSLLPSLLACRKSNQDAGNAGVRLYEVASTWHRRDGVKVEQRRLGLLADVADVEGEAGATEAVLRTVRGAIDEMVMHLGAAAPTVLTPVEASGFEVVADVSLGDVMLGR